MIIYYWQAVKSIMSAWLVKYVRRGHVAEDRLSDVQLGNQLIIATIPTLIIGFVMEKQINSQTNNIKDHHSHHTQVGYKIKVDHTD